MSVIEKSGGKRRFLCRMVVFLSMTGALPGVALAEGDQNGFDANHDGQITLEEVMQRLEPAVRRAFEAMDRNGDGVLSEHDFDDLREGLDRLQRWFDELLPFPPGNPESTEQRGGIET